MSSVTGVSLNAIFPSGLVDRQQMAASQQPRPESPLFVPVGEAQKTMRGENRREINPDERQGAGRTIVRDTNSRGADSASGDTGLSSGREVNASRSAGRDTGPDAAVVSDQALQEQRELARRDREVRTHEQAHKAIAGQYAGQVRYEYTQGPDGRRYAVSGSVEVDLRPAEDPEKTIEKMEQVLRAALAPSEPSVADRQIAAQANQLILEARAEALREQRQGEDASASNVSGAEESDTVGGDSVDKDDAVALRTSEAAREAASERARDAERERASEREDDQDNARVDEQRNNVNTDSQQRLLAVQDAIAELLRNQGGSLDDVTLGRSINFEV